MLPVGMVYLVRLRGSLVRYQPLMSMSAPVVFLNSMKGSAVVLGRTSLKTMELLLSPGSGSPGAPLMVVLARQPSWVPRTSLEALGSTATRLYPALSVALYQPFL